MAEGIALLGVEFLTPGHARSKRGLRKAPAQSLQHLVLRSLLEKRLGGLDPGDPARLFWRSLASDLDSAEKDFTELIGKGYRPADFPSQELRDLFGDYVGWMTRHGFPVAPLEDEAAGLGRAELDLAPIAERLLIIGGGAEHWGEFFGLAALARRCPSTVVSLAEPEFGGDPGVGWIRLWESLLGVEARLNEAQDPAETCSDVVQLCTGAGGSADKAELVVGRSVVEEMELVAQRIERLLAAGADNIGVVFPRADAAHALLARSLAGRGIAFADLIGSVGTPPVDTRIQRMIAQFHAKGRRFEELLALWPLLRAQNLVKASSAEARGVCDKLFDEVQEHEVDPHVAALEKSAEGSWREVGRVARLLLPAWPSMLTLAQALGLFEAARDHFMAAAPAGWDSLREFAARAPEPMPAAAILEAILAFLPEKAPLEGAAGRGRFAHVTLTTVRRAAGIAWSDVFLVEANKGTWPEKREPGCWLADEDRRRLTEAGRFTLGLPTSGEREAMETRLYASVCRDTRARVVFSASGQDAKDSEKELEPNTWLERLLWNRGKLSGAGSGTGGFGSAAGAARTVPSPCAGFGPWLEIWKRRREPTAPFDEFFFCDPSRPKPHSLPARLIERGVGDPVHLWFESVMGVRPVPWRELRRARKKLMGTVVHRLVAVSLRGAPHEGDLFRMPSLAEAMAKLAGASGDLRPRWPDNLYWDSFRSEAAWAAAECIRAVFGSFEAPYAGAEMRMPDGAFVCAGTFGPVRVRGRMDLVLFEKPQWKESRVEIIDFKTGSDKGVSAQRMASNADALQLGIYLEAASSLGATGSVWMLKPGGSLSGMSMDELGVALAKLHVLGDHLATGRYGALTPDRSRYVHGFEWPLACVPIPRAVLERKFDATFGRGQAAASTQGDNEG